MLDERPFARYHAGVRPEEPWRAPNVYYAEGYTPLHLATLSDRLEEVQVLLAQGAHPNAEVLAPGAIGFTALDLAVSRRLTRLIPVLVRAGARPGARAWIYRENPANRELVAHLDEELRRNRAVEVAEQLAQTPWRIQEARRLLEEGQHEEAQVTLEPLRGWGPETDDSLHLRIRSLVATSQPAQAMEEASVVFAFYRDQGLYRQALLVSREMRKIDPQSARPYELELRFLLDLGCPEEARRCQEELLELHRRRGDRSEERGCERRFQLLQRAASLSPPEPRPRPSLGSGPAVWEGPSWFESDSPGLNLPAPAAPSMQEWQQRFLGGRRYDWDWTPAHLSSLTGRRVSTDQAARERYELLRRSQSLNVWEEYAPVVQRMHAPSLRELEDQQLSWDAAMLYIFPDDQSWSLVLTRRWEVYLIELEGE
ncbi:MAG: hypothetical protein AMXMBFR33_19480 [Candidatus Xenobia bacterium]